MNFYIKKTQWVPGILSVSPESFLFDRNYKKYFLGKFFCNFAMEFYTATWYTVTKNETNPKKGRKDTCRYYTRAQEAKAKQ